MNLMENTYQITSIPVLIHPENHVLMWGGEPIAITAGGNREGLSLDYYIETNTGCFGNPVTMESATRLPRHLKFDADSKKYWNIQQFGGIVAITSPTKLYVYRNYRKDLKVYVLGYDPHAITSVSRVDTIWVVRTGFRLLLFSDEQ